jgi:CheY-like chemotaxis protein
MATSTPRTILVIDDDPSIVRGLTRLLGRDGYRVETAPNGRDALTQLQHQGYDVILIDLHMTTLDGRVFYTLLQQRAPALCQRVIFLTWDEDDAFLQQSGRPWLRKPYLIATLRRLIHQRVAPQRPMH